MKKWNQAVAVAAIMTTIASPLSVTAAPLTNNAGLTADTRFADQDTAADWAQQALSQVKQLGIMQGDAAEMFRPADKLTRQEFASVLVHMLALQVDEASVSSFQDVPNDSWAVSYIELVNKLGFMTGDGANFRPNDPISREEVAATLIRVLGINVQGEGAKLEVADENEISDWAKDAVQFLYKYEIMQGDGTYFAPKRSAQRQEIAVIISKALPFFNVSLGHSINEVHDDHVVIDGVTYTVADSLKGLFREANQQILAGAKIKFEAAGRELTKVTYLEITSGGQPAAQDQAEFSSNLVLQGDGAQIDGDMLINGDFVSVYNLTVAGSLEITSALEHDFYSENLKVVGTTKVNGGDSNTVVFNNDILGSMVINKPNVRVEPKGSSTIGDITVNANSTITADSGITLPKISITAEAQQVELNTTVGTLEIMGSNDAVISGKLNADQLNLSREGMVSFNMTGTINKLQVTGTNTKLTLNKGMKINSLTLPSGGQANTLISNYSETKTIIGSIISGTQGTGSGGGSSSGGGSNGGSSSGGSSNGSDDDTNDDGSSNDDSNNGGSSDNGSDDNGSSDDGSDNGGSTTINQAPIAKNIHKQQMNMNQPTGMSLSPDDLATDADGDAISFVTGSVTVGNSVYASANIHNDMLWITPIGLGSTDVGVNVTDGTHSAHISIPVQIIQDEALVANVVGGSSTFDAHHADEPTVIRVEQLDSEGNEVENLDLSNLVLNNADYTLVKNTDYTVNNAVYEVSLEQSYLNSLSVGLYNLSLSKDSLTAYTAINVQSNIVASIQSGGKLIEHSAGTEAVIDLQFLENGTPVQPADLSNLVIKCGDEVLVKDIDYTLNNQELVINIDFLNQLSVGAASLTINDDSYSGNVELTIVPVDPVVQSAIDELNAADEADVLSILTSSELGLQLTPFSYLSSGQQTSVAHTIYVNKDTGYVSRSEIQDELDIAVYELQTAGNEATAVQAVNDATTVDDMLAALMLPALHLDNENYSSLEDYETEIVAQYMIDHKGTGYANRDAIQSSFNQIINTIFHDWFAMIDDLNNLHIFAIGDSAKNVTQNLILPTSGAINHSTIQWSSSNPDVISDTGIINPRSSDTTVVLTALFKYGVEHLSYPIELTVKGIGGATPLR